MEKSWSLFFEVFLLGAIICTALGEPPSLSSTPSVGLLSSDGVTVTWPAWTEGTDAGTGPVASYFVLVRSTGDPGFDSEFDAGLELSIKVEPLSSEEEYVITVVCADGSGARGDSSPELIVTIPCGVPSDPPILTNLETVNTTALRLRWVPPSPLSWGCSSLDDILVAYEYKRSGTDDDFPLHSNHPRTPMNDGELIIAGLEACTTYDVGVYMYASTANEFSDSVSVINGTTELEPVGPINNPNALSQENLGAGLILTWAAPSASSCLPDSYTISYALTSRLACPDTEVTPEVVELSTEQSTYVLKEGVTEYYSQYEFNITGVNGLGMGETVTYMAATSDNKPVSSPVPTLREDLSAPGELHFNWTAIPCEDVQGIFRRYLCELFEGSDRVRYFQKGNFDEREGSFTGLPGCTEYGFRVRVTNSKGRGEFSDFVMVTTTETAPGFVKDLTSTAEPDVSTAVNVSWVPDDTEPCPADSYTAEYTLSLRDQCEEVEGATTMVAPVVMAPEASLLIEGLEPYSTYQVAVYASNGGGNASRVEMMAVTGEQAPTAPPGEVGAFVVEYDRLAFSFTEPPCGTRGGRILGYEYELRNVETGDVTNGTTQTLEVMLEGLDRYTEYGIMIRAENSIGVGEFSEEVLQYTSEGLPTEPLDVDTYDTPSASLPLTWMPPAQPNGFIAWYEVEVRDLETDMPMILNFTDVGMKPHQLLVSDVEPTKEYSIMVRAINEAGPSNWSKPLTVEILEGAPSPVSDLIVEEVTEDSIRITWSPPLQPKGTISKYTAEYTVGERPYLQGGDQKRSTNFFEMSPEDRSLELVDLEPSTEYLITVWAHTAQERGEPTMLEQYTSPPDEVPAPEDVKLLTAEVRDDGTMVIKLPHASYKYATHYQIGVHCRDVADEPLFFSGANFSSECSYITGEVPNMEKEQEFIIGDGETYGDYENRPLDKEREYDIYVSLVSRTEQSSSVSWNSEPLIAEERSPALVLLWIFIVILLIVLIVILILCVCAYCRKKQEKKKPPSSPEENVPLE